MTWCEMVKLAGSRTVGWELPAGMVVVRRDTPVPWAASARIQSYLAAGWTHTSL